MDRDQKGEAVISDYTGFIIKEFLKKGQQLNSLWSSNKTGLYKRRQKNVNTNISYEMKYLPVSL